MDEKSMWSRRYSEDPEAERRDLQDIRRKYGINGKKVKKTLRVLKGEDVENEEKKLE